MKLKKSIIIWHYSKGTYQCNCCGVNDTAFLEIDHKENNGSVHKKAIRSGSNFYNWLIKYNLPPEYQVLCSNCNQAKRKFGGICPHKSDKLGTPLSDIRLLFGDL